MLIKILSAWASRFENPWPDARPLPPHVQAVKLNPKLLHLHMERAAHPPLPVPRAP